MDQPETSLKPNILVAPLDWGLGHATRCIPIVNRLLALNAQVILAGEGRVRSLLEKEFPQLGFIDLKGYNISYSMNKWTLPFVLATQVPKILSAIKYENEWLKETAQEHAIDGIISDNRFGLYHETLPSVFVTHQLLIKTGFGKNTDHFLQQLNYSYINRFTECWVPDNVVSPNLAGKLSHPKKLPVIPLQYIGPLSRFSSSQKEKEKHILILMSGPEPQRTMLEELFLEQLHSYKGPVILIRGLPGETNDIIVPPNVTVYNHLAADVLQKKLREASFIISRCGYSTVMDLAFLKKKSILIPTPGQREQEYLAEHLQKINFALCIEQKKFKLKKALDLAGTFNYHLNLFKPLNILEQTVQGFLDLVATKKQEPLPA